MNVNTQACCSKFVCWLLSEKNIDIRLYCRTDLLLMNFNVNFSFKYQALHKDFEDLKFSRTMFRENISPEIENLNFRNYMNLKKIA